MSFEKGGHMLSAGTYRNHSGGHTLVLPYVRVADGSKNGRMICQFPDGEWHYKWDWNGVVDFTPARPDKEV